MQAAYDAQTDSESQQAASNQDRAADQHEQHQAVEQSRALLIPLRRDELCRCRLRLMGRQESDQRAVHQIAGRLLCVLRRQKLGRLRRDVGCQFVHRLDNG